MLSVRFTVTSVWQAKAKTKACKQAFHRRNYFPLLESCEEKYFEETDLHRENECETYVLTNAKIACFPMKNSSFYLSWFRCPIQHNKPTLLAMPRFGREVRLNSL
jgi:hypothetical protein